MVLGLFFQQKTAYEMRISDWSSDVCASDLGKPMRRVKPRARSCRQRRRTFDILDEARERVIRFGSVGDAQQVTRMHRHPPGAALREFLRPPAFAADRNRKSVG